MLLVSRVVDLFHRPRKKRYKTNNFINTKCYGREKPLLPVKRLYLSKAFGTSWHSFSSNRSLGPDIESLREILVNDFIGLQKQEFSPRFKIIILLKWPTILLTSKAHKFIKMNSKNNVTISPMF